MYTILDKIIKHTNSKKINKDKKFQISNCNLNTFNYYNKWFTESKYIHLKIVIKYCVTNSLI